MPQINVLQQHISLQHAGDLVATSGVQAQAVEKVARTNRVESMLNELTELNTAREVTLGTQQH